MAAQKGRDVVLKTGTAAGGTAIAGLRMTSFRVNGEAVDVTTKDSLGVRELLAGAGVSSVSITANGIVSDNDDLLTLAGYAKAMSLNTFGVVFGDGDKIDGSWQITSFEAGGGYNDAQSFSLTLESSGTVTFTTV